MMENLLQDFYKHRTRSSGRSHDSFTKLDTHGRIIDFIVRWLCNVILDRITNLLSYAFIEYINEL